MRIVDTHLHLIYPDKFSYPWLSGVPPLDKPWTADSYFAEAEPLGIETALHMEVDVAEPDMEAESRFVLGGLDPLSAAPSRPGDREHVIFPTISNGWRQCSGVKGVRRILHTQPDDLSQARPVRR